MDDLKDNVKRLLKIYSEMEWDERKQVRDFIQDFEKKEYSEKRKINESFQKSLGPLMSNTCPYCGK